MADKAVLEAKTRVVEAELRQEIGWLKKDKDAFQNKTRMVEAELFTTTGPSGA
eukprot:SAG31_NODE_17035_length_685_cov_3.749147_2_plen_53_part_01